MKPLELTIYPKMGSVYYDDEANCTWSESMVYGLSVEKRLTDAELAAEYWAMYSEYVREASNVLHCQERYMEAAGKSFKEADRKCRVLHRFATLPHYDEAQP